MSEDDGRTTRLRGRLVEGVRLIFMALIAAVGYQIGAARADVNNERQALLYVFLGAACGYVLGGVFGRLTLEAVSGLEQELRRRPAAQIAGGGGGGRDTMAQAGGREPEKLPEALATARVEIERALS